MSQSMFDSIRKRRAFPVEGMDAVFIRLLNKSEKRRQLEMQRLMQGRRAQIVERLNKAKAECRDESMAAKSSVVACERELQDFDNEAVFNYFTLALLLCDKDGTLAYVPAEGESDEQFAKRVAKDMVDVDDASLSLIGQTYQRLQKHGEPRTAAQVEAIAKN